MENNRNNILEYLLGKNVNNNTNINNSVNFLNNNISSNMINDNLNNINNYDLKKLYILNALNNINQNNNNSNNLISNYSGLSDIQLNYLNNKNSLSNQNLQLLNQLDNNLLLQNKINQNIQQQNYSLNSKNLKLNLNKNSSNKYQKILQNKNINNIQSNNTNYSNMDSIKNKNKKIPLIQQTSKSSHSSNIVNLYKMDNETIIKEAYNLTKDQIGCRFLQKKIEEDTNFAISFLYPIIIEHLDEIVNDKFGNYLIQKFFEYLSQKEIFLFMNSIKDNFLYIGLNQYGTRVIQKIMDYIKSSGDSTTVKNYNFFVFLLTPNIIQFSNDLNGCHIIQKVLLTENFDNKFCYDFYRENIIRIANDKNGCCFIQKCIDKLNTEQLNNILESIFSKTKEIIVDQYGNYVIQYVLKTIKEQNNNKYNLEKIFKFIVDDLVTYSNQKYCSNVIEKLFTIDELRIALIKKLEEPQIMKSLLFAQFGNYVVQKALNYSNKEEQTKLLSIIATMVEDLKKLEYGFKLYNKLISKYPNLLTIIYNMNNNVDDEVSNKNNFILGNKDNNIKINNGTNNDKIDL